MLYKNGLGYLQSFQMSLDWFNGTHISLYQDSFIIWEKTKRDKKDNQFKHKSHEFLITQKENPL